MWLYYISIVGTAKELRRAKPGQRRWSEIPPGQVCAGNPGDLLGSFHQKLEIASMRISRARCMLHHTPQKETISRTLQFCKHICGGCEGWYCSLIQLIGYIKVNGGRELHTFAIGIVSRPWQIRIRRAQALQLLGQDLGRKASERLVVPNSTKARFFKRKLLPPKPRDKMQARMVFFDMKYKFFSGTMIP